ncbi:MAG: zf-HC2 domain-containing protein [Pirellulales bacterium]|nr:zf-HC2 domain-containing protein [Pirellulales bacterium]
MRCNTVRRRLDRFARQEVTPRLRASIEGHLSECPDCRAYRAQQERLAALLEDAPEPLSVPEGFANQLMAAARQRLAGRPVPSSRRRVGRRWISVPLDEYAARAAVLAAGLLVGVLIGQQTWQSVHAPGVRQTSRADPLAAYALDSLSDAPGGSLAEGYLTLTTASNHNGN